MITTSMGMWREQLADTPETGVQVPARTANKKLRYLNGFILFLYHVNGKVKYNLQNILFCVLVVWRCRFESPHARLIRREYHQGSRVVWVNTLQVQVRFPACTANRREYPQGARVVWVNTLQVQVRVPACTANKEGVPPGFKSVLVVMRSVVWVNTLQVQVRVPARTANKKLSVLVVMRSVVWVNILQVQVRVPALKANKMLR
ncbi:unnamed protein product [Boreogadus saida]